jgi:hypothetical protein
MFSIVKPEVLRSYSLEQVDAYRKEAELYKKELEELKAASTDEWTDEKQNDLDEVVMLLVDIDDIIEEKVKKQGPAYSVPAGTEKMVHLLLVKGRRFNPHTGTEESKEYKQMFTYAEWQLFKQNFAALGYAIVKVLHDPYGEVKAAMLKK